MRNSISLKLSHFFPKQFLNVLDNGEVGKNVCFNDSLVTEDIFERLNKKTVFHFDTLHFSLI